METTAQACLEVQSETGIMGAQDNNAGGRGAHDNNITLYPTLARCSETLGWDSMASTLMDSKCHRDADKFSSLLHPMK